MTETATPPPPKLMTRLARRPYALLALLCLALWLPGILSLPALDRDESRFAQSSRQMLDSGNFVDIRFGQVPRYKKPVGIYWMQAATTAVAGLGDHSRIWTYRLPSLLGGIAAVWLTFWCAQAFAGVEAALLAALLLGTCVLLTAEATIATTDAVLLACTTGMQGALLRVYRAGAEDGAPAPSLRVVLSGWACLALGILVKGPVAAGVAAATVIGLVAWERRWRWLAATRPLPGVALSLIIVLPWLVAIAIQSHGAFFEQSLGNDFAAKIAGGQESHGAWPGYYLILSTLSFWPAILFVAPAIAMAVLRRGEPMIRFALAWAGGWWLLCEIVPTKLPHYVLPAYPALAMLAALWLLAPAEENPGWRRYLSGLAGLQFVAGLAALAAAPLVLPRLYGDGDVLWLQGLAGFGALLGLAALILFALGRRWFALPLMLASALVLVPALTAGVGPRLTQLWMSERLAALVARDSKPGDPSPALAGFEEPSLVFALGADVGLTGGSGAAEQGANQGGLALVADDERSAFLARLAELQADAAIVDDLTGFNYSRGRNVHVTLYRVTQVHQTDAPPAN